MCKCSFVRVASFALATLFLITHHTVAQEYDVEEPNNDEMVFTGVQANSVNLIFDTNDIIVNPGDKLELGCGVQGAFRYCIWQKSQAEIYQVDDVYDDVYNGFTRPLSPEGNECGIVINSATIEQHGSWSCTAFFKGGSIVKTKNVIVTIQPTNPLLEVEKSRGFFEISDEDDAELKCSVAAARPAVNIRWYLGNRDITVEAVSEETPTDEGGIYKSVSTLRHMFHPEENNQPLTCSISHQTLDMPKNDTIPVSVIFKPVEKPLSTYYQITSGKDYEVKFNFTANPVPTRIEWKFGDNFDNMIDVIPVPGTDQTGRYHAADIEELGEGQYTARLYIKDFTEEDASKRYLLFVENRQGMTEYQVQLSMDEAPLDALSGGAVAGIIIVVLIVVVAVVAAGYARYRQMFCFAPARTTTDIEEGKDIKEEHDTESARGPNTTHTANNLKNSFGKLTQVFKKPKKDQESKKEEGINGDEEKKNLAKEEENKNQPDEKEVVYAELDLSKGEIEKRSDIKSEEKTEYAQIIGTVTDNKEEEKKE